MNTLRSHTMIVFSASATSLSLQACRSTETTVLEQFASCLIFGPRNLAQYPLTLYGAPVPLWAARPLSSVAAAVTVIAYCPG